MTADPPVQELDYLQFLGEVRVRTGIDLASYKAEQMRRRLDGLMARSDVTDYGMFLRLLETNPERLRQFRDFITINVSEFFRSPDRFADLRDVVLPRLLQERSHLRIWSAGCSYGAEPYSIALLLHELTPGARHYILATDVDETVLARARAATDFREEDVRHVPRRGRYFEAREDRFALASDVRSQVTFRHHDLLTDTFEGDFDLIICRNVMMYFSTAAKSRLATLLYDALRSGGYLFCGSSEAMQELADAGFAPELVGFYARKG